MNEAKDSTGPEQVSTDVELTLDKAGGSFYKLCLEMDAMYPGGPIFQPAGTADPPLSGSSISQLQSNEILSPPNNPTHYTYKVNYSPLEDKSMDQTETPSSPKPKRRRARRAAQATWNREEMDSIISILDHAGFAGSKYCSSARDAARKYAMFIRSVRQHVK